MTGTAQCALCNRSQTFEVEKDPRHPMHRSGVIPYMENLRRSLSRRHRKTTGCRSSRFTIRFDLEPPSLVATGQGARP